MSSIDLNADIGEGFSHDLELLGIVSSANVCCGTHAGGQEVTLATVKLCQERDVRIGAHPGTPDRESMGRARLTDLSIRAGEILIRSIRNQVGTLAELGASYVKLHGTLYNQGASEEDVAALVCDGLRGFGLPFLGLRGTLHESIASQLSVRFVSEGFADRSYKSDGTLVPRSEEGAVITEVDGVCSQARTLAGRVDSICLHGDTPGCVELARAVRSALMESGIEVRTCL